MLKRSIFVVYIKKEKEKEKVIPSNFRKSYTVREPLSFYDVFLFKTLEIEFFLLPLSGVITSCGD